MIKSNFQRTNSNNQVLLFDCDQTIRNGGGTCGIIRKAVCEMEQERGMTLENIENIKQETVEEGRLGTDNFTLALCNNDINEFDQLCSELFPRVDYSKVHKDRKLFKALKKASKKYNLYLFINAHRHHFDICCKIIYGFGIDAIKFMKWFDITESYENGKCEKKMKKVLKKHVKELVQPCLNAY